MTNGPKARPDSVVEAPLPLTTYDTWGNEATDFTGFVTAGPAARAGRAPRRFGSCRTPPGLRALAPRGPSPGRARAARASRARPRAPAAPAARALAGPAEIGRASCRERVLC